MRNLIFPILLGVTGCAILLWLGFWQLQRLEWKEGLLAGIDGRLAAAPVPLSLNVSRAEDNYRGVIVVGRPTGEELHVLVSGTAAGTGFRVISKFKMQAGPEIMVDQGLLGLENKDAAPSTALTEIQGNLIWPDDKNSATPEPDLDANTWFARDVLAMSQHLDSLPIMIVARSSSNPDPRLTALPVNTANIKNDHLNYAITWFLLAAVWAAMTVFLIRRTRQKDAL